MQITVHNGITFFEGRPTQFEELQRVSIELGGIISQVQLKTLNDVKELMAQRARNTGGNAIIDFTYGQKSVGWFRSILQLDDVNWYGHGVIAKVPDST